LTAGSSSTVPGIRNGCTWHVRELPVPRGLAYAYPLRSDGAKSAAGIGVDAARELRPVVWRGGRASWLDTPGNVPGEAVDINRSGYAVGNEMESGPDSFEAARAFLWRPDGRVAELGVPRGLNYVLSWGINDRGTIVGFGGGADGVPHAVAWDVKEPGKGRDLGTYRGYDTNPSDVTNEGVIIGSATSPETFQPIAIRGTVQTGFRPLPGVDLDAGSFATEADGDYILGNGKLADGSNGELGGSLLWDGNRPKALPEGFSGSNVNVHGVVVGFLPLGVPAVLVRGRTTELPPLSTVNQGSSVSDITDDAVAFGSSRDDLDRLRPVTWNCR
jgi:hypothetical protein